ncbi:hypothetical protein DB346_08545 [Verrucomicrobia bacterium LW23]|nr:hypothetical protein DB346_08545 [Verrucomicrobia bacterium LW23]
MTYTNTIGVSGLLGMTILAQAQPVQQAQGQMGQVAASGHEIGMWIVAASAVLFCVNQAIQIYQSTRSRDEERRREEALAREQALERQIAEERRIEAERRAAEAERRQAATEARIDRWQSATEDNIKRLHDRVDGILEKLSEG